MERNEGTARLWLEPEHRALTTAETGSGQPAISPDETQLAFLRRIGEQPQLHVMPLDGGEPEKITDLPLGGAGPRRFPCSRPSANNAAWRFTSPRERAGRGHVAGFDPSRSPKSVDPDRIRLGSLASCDDDWKDDWPRLCRKHGMNRP